MFTIRWGHANLVMELGYLSLLKVMNIPGSDSHQ